MAAENKTTPRGTSASSDCLDKCFAECRGSPHIEFRPKAALRVLFAAWSNDPFIETIERHLHKAIEERGGQLLCVVEERRPSDDGIPSIDLAEAMRVEPDRSDGGGIPDSELDRIVEDTHWFETTVGLQVERRAVRDRLATTARHARYILRTYRPDAVLVWNGLLSQRAVIATLARQMHLPVWFCERGALPGSFYVDPRGVNGDSSLVEAPLTAGLSETLDTALPPLRRREIIAQIEAVARSGASAWEQPPRSGPHAWRKKLGIPDGVKCLFFPLQVDADTNMRFFSPNFANSLQALGAVAEAIGRTGDWFLLVKPHPKGSDLPSVIDRVVGSKGRCVADINLHDALALATLVVTINSTVATEAAWQNKPVLQLGRGILSGKRIVSEFDASRPLHAQLEQAMHSWHDEPERFERGLRFYQFLDAGYLLHADDPADAHTLVDRLFAAGSRPAASSGPRQEAAAIVHRFTWRPAVRLLDQLAQRRPRPKEVILLGYGQNARRLLQAAKLHPGAGSLHFSVWDDGSEVRRQASEKGLALHDPWAHARRPADSLIVVTPRNPAHLLDRLAAYGCSQERDYTCLCPTLKETQ